MVLVSPVQARECAGNPGSVSKARADLSLHRTVTGNIIRDVTGMGIAIRGSPATQVVQNTIVARDRDMLAGVAIVAHPAFRGSSRPDQGVIVR